MKNAVLNTLSSLDRIIVVTLKWVCISLFAALTIILTVNIIVRFVPVMSMHWFDEVVELIYAALVFLGAAILWIDRAHFSVGDWISKYVKNRYAKLIYRLIIELISLMFVFIFFKYSLDLVMKTEELTTAFAMSKKILYACMPISGAIMVIYSIKNMYLEFVKIFNRK